ncbi:MAG: hypothetical protein ACYTF7_01710 [Planctomycetota bacterium]|jgi:cbb3-type cytochrome oxidase subunit 3
MEMFMRIITSVDISFYPQAAMVIFLLVFVFVLWRAIRLNTREDVSRLANLALDDNNDIIDTEVTS